VPCSGARVDVAGTKDGQPRTLSYACADKMGRLTGFPVAIGAVMLAQREIRAPGVFAPEGIIEPEPFFAALAERSIPIHVSESV
jgi:saccharopine dehydrogenase-like NADP-dependent oxidoreductase